MTPWTVTRPARALVAALLLAVLGGLSVTVPLLDRDPSPAGVVLTEDGAESAQGGHDHGICLQHGTAAWVVADGTETPLAPDVSRDDPPTTRRPGIPAALERTLHPRAPPIA